MRFLTHTECEAWAMGAGHAVSLRHGFSARELPHFSVRIPMQPSHYAFSRSIAGCLEPRSHCLLWVVEHGVWPSSENWHLYYRLRQSYGDVRLLHEAPGHLFLDYEESDLVTYLQVMIDCGWDVEILPQLTYGGAGSARAFLSHDELVVLAHRDENVLDDWGKPKTRAAR